MNMPFRPLEVAPTMLRWLSSTWWVLLLKNPHIYLSKLLKDTLMMGVLLSILYVIMRLLEFDGNHFSAPIHTIIGLVIGLLLVFRTNSAYERWWDARKLFASLHGSMMTFKVIAHRNDPLLNAMTEVNRSIFRMLNTDDQPSSLTVQKSLMKAMIDVDSLTDPSIRTEVRRVLSDISDKASHLERIKDTPIPLSYTFHIKISVFAYLLSLPFGVFFNLGVWSIPMVMILFFIIAGIEIISNEIENPFRNDPNDLPIGEYEAANNALLTASEE